MIKFPKMELYLSRNWKIAIVAAIVLTGCQTTGPNGGTLISVTTKPADAQLTVEGYGACQTPCTVELQKPRRATLAKAGFQKEEILLHTDRRRVHIPMRLSAPTEEIETDTLPDLN